MNRIQQGLSSQSNARSCIALLGLCILTFLLYYPGLSGGFVHDDYINIIQNPTVHVDTLKIGDLSQVFIEVGSGTPGLFSRPVAQLSFLLNHLFSGLDPYGFKLVNLVIHLATGTLIYLFALFLHRALLLRSPQQPGRVDAAQGQWIALLTAGLWLLNPLHVSTVLYAVQRMAQLSTLFTLGGFILYLLIRIRQIEGSEHSSIPPLVVSLFILWPLGIFSKENAVILPLLCLVSEISIFRFQKISSPLKLLHGALVTITLLFVAYCVINPDVILSTYKGRDFGLSQRLLTESRLLWDYVGRLLLPDISHMGLYNDDVVVSKGLMRPVTTLISLFGWGIVLLLALLSRRKYPVLGFAVLWFLTAHLIESSVIGLELAYEHRNYLPSAGLLFGIASACIWLATNRQKLRRPVLFGCIVMLCLFSVLTLMRTNQWADVNKLIISEAQNHPRSYRANAELVRLLISNGRYQDASEVVIKAENSERVSADIYFAKLSLEHILHGQINEPLFRETLQNLSQMQAYISITNKLTAYITDASRYQWETTEQLIEITRAIQANPHLTDNRSQGNLHFILAKLYSDAGDVPLFNKEMNLAYELFPENISITKVYINLLLINNEVEKAKEILEQQLSRAMFDTERAQFEELKKSF